MLFNISCAKGRPRVTFQRKLGLGLEGCLIVFNLPTFPSRRDFSLYMLMALVVLREARQGSVPGLFASVPTRVFTALPTALQLTSASTQRNSIQSMCNQSGRADPVRAAGAGGHHLVTIEYKALTDKHWQLASAAGQPDQAGPGRTRQCSPAAARSAGRRGDRADHGTAGMMSEVRHNNQLHHDI